MAGNGSDSSEIISIKASVASFLLTTGCTATVINTTTTIIHAADVMGTMIDVIPAEGLVTKIAVIYVLVVTLDADAVAVVIRSFAFLLRLGRSNLLLGKTPPKSQAETTTKYFR